MRLTVKVKAQSKVEKVEKISEGQFAVRVKAPAKEGKANQAVIALLARYFDIPKSSLTILRGNTSKIKLIDVCKREGV